jgi:hypothetical protein
MDDPNLVTFSNDPSLRAFFLALVAAFREAASTVFGGTVGAVAQKTEQLEWTVAGSGFWVSPFDFTLLRLTFKGNCTEVILSRDATTSLVGAVPLGQSGAIIAVVHGLANENPSEWVGRSKIAKNEKIFAYVGGSATVALDMCIEMA